MITTIMWFIIAIGMLVIVHEFGHYAVARLCGVRIVRFSIGFGASLVKWNQRGTGTEWRIGALPLGGYVKMLDERDSDTPIAAQALPYAFNRQPVSKRFAIVSAGPLANFVLAIALLASLYVTGVSEPAAIVAAPAAHTAAAIAGFAGGERIVGLRTSDHDQIKPIRSWPELRWKLLDAVLNQASIVLIAKQRADTYDFPLNLSSVKTKTGHLGDPLIARLGFEPGGARPVMTRIQPDSPADKAGLREGDVVRAVNGAPVYSVPAFIALVRAHPGDTISLEVDRAGQRKRLSIVPMASRSAVASQAVGRIGATVGGAAQTVKVQYDLFEALTLSMRRCWEISLFSLRMFSRMITGQASLKNLSGPLTIAEYAGKSAHLGVTHFVSFLALISISLGVLNLLPIPVLDGGYLLYYLVEIVTGRAVPDHWQFILQRVGIACLFILSAIALFNDLTRLISS